MDIDPEHQLSLVRNPEVGRALLNHPRRQLVKSTDNAYYYLDDQGKYRILQGLLPRLKEVYWPRKSYKKLTKGITKSSGGPRRKGRGRFQGMIRGKDVHKQLENFIRLDGKNFQKLHPEGLHDYTERVLRALVGRLELRMFLSELNIYDETLRIGTQVDGIPLDKDGKLVLVEVKTGYKDYFQTIDGTMQHSLKNFANSMKNRATLQLTAAALILQRCYQVPLDRMRLYIIRVDDESLDIIPVQNEFVEKIGPGIYSDLLKANTRKLKKKAQKKLQKRK